MKSGVTSSTISDSDYALMNNSGVPLSSYFTKKRSPQSKRFNHFVLLPISPSFVSTDKLEPCLDFDSNELVQMSATTITMIQEEKKKVYPYPIFLGSLTGLPEVIHSKITSLSSISSCRNNLVSETQFTPTFDIVGHGTPGGIGFLDPACQKSPQQLANLIDSFFILHNLGALKSRRLNFVLHSCNSAYAKIDDSMTKDEILKKVRTESFIGKFYDHMMSLGFGNISVSGYRGYYCNLSHRSSYAMVQDAAYSPKISLSAEKAKYTICNNKCIADDDRYLTFPVPFLDSATTQASEDYSSSADSADQLKVLSSYFTGSNRHLAAGCDPTLECDMGDLGEDGDHVNDTSASEIPPSHLTFIGPKIAKRISTRCKPDQVELDTIEQRLTLLKLHHC